MRSVTVVGFSTAGLAAAETLRRGGFSGELTIVSGESHLPYDRPPQTKTFLHGERTVEDIELRPRSNYESLGARMLRGVDAVELDVEGRRVTVSSGDVVTSDAIVIATGVRARRLPTFNGLSGVHTIRDVEDAVALRAEIAALAAPAHVVVVGGGVLGCEVASTTRKFGHQVTLVDQGHLPSVRQFGPWVAKHIQDLHEAHGVHLAMGQGVRGVRADRSGRVACLELDSGAVLEADVVVVAVGSVPNTDWLAGSGLPISNGVDGDEFCQVAPGIVAAGDVASWVNGSGLRVRAEDKTNAVTHGVSAARRLLGSAKAYDPVSFFWTEQFGAMIQAYGSCSDADQVQVMTSNYERGSFTALLGREERVVGAVAWNEPVGLRKLRRMVDEQASWSEASEGPGCSSQAMALAPFGQTV